MKNLNNPEIQLDEAGRRIEASTQQFLKKSRAETLASFESLRESYRSLGKEVPAWLKTHFPAECDKSLNGGKS